MWVGGVVGFIDSQRLWLCLAHMRSWRVQMEDISERQTCHVGFKAIAEGQASFGSPGNLTWCFWTVGGSRHSHPGPQKDVSQLVDVNSGSSSYEASHSATEMMVLSEMYISLFSVRAFGSHCFIFYTGPG